uniref:REM-1 domain-containing protein n=1 Tax=Salmo trutta TaxID=8032 RepID=A0A674ERU6_SALTR
SVVQLNVFNLNVSSESESEVQRQIGREVRMCEGANKLLAACSQRDQALESFKSLLTRNTRIMVLLSQLQRMREVQVLQRREGACVLSHSLSRCPSSTPDLRIPLMWKDSEYFKDKRGESHKCNLHRCAVFCLLQCGREIYDTDLVMADMSLTDICPGFELRCLISFCGGPKYHLLAHTTLKMAHV